MSSYVDLGELVGGVYFHTATLDDRFTWAEIDPASYDGHDAGDLLEQSGDQVVWVDGLKRFRLVDCAHLEIYRNGKLCSFCGHANPYEPPARTAARKRRGKK